MGQVGNRIDLLDQTILSLVMILLWTRSEMWGHSLWVNETDTMSFAEHGLSGFGYGYGGLVFLLHMMWRVFGEVDVAYRGLSLFFSTVTMVLIYRISSSLHGRKGGIVASFIFLWSGYGIEFGMQVRDYAIHSCILMWIAYWCFQILDNAEESDSGGKLGFSALIASFGVWFVSDHWFCLFFLFFLFTCFLMAYLQNRSREEVWHVLPKTVIPPICTLAGLLIIELVRILNAVTNSLNGEHHLGGGSVPLVILKPSIFLERITGGSIILASLVLVSIIIGILWAFIRSDKSSERMLGLLAISTSIMWISLAIGQFHLHGLIVERYFYFWFPLVCVICGSSISVIIVRVSEFERIDGTALNIIPYLLIALISLTVDIEPDTAPYGDMRGGFEMIEEAVDDSSFTIISRPPEHVLQYYLRQFELSPEEIIGAWHLSELDSDAVGEIDSEIVVVISLQSGWILEESSNLLEGSGYHRDEASTFSNSGDTIWIWRK